MQTETQLTAEQRQEAQHHEKTIDDGLSSYVEVGLALREIQQKRLHEGRFIVYAEDRFAMKSHTIYRLMRAAEVAKNLMDAGLARPKNVGQAHRIHDLAKDDPAEQVELWKRVIESGVPLTLSQIDRIANEQDEGSQSFDEEESDAEGEVDMDSAHHVKPISPLSLDADPLPCLRRVTQELQAVNNAIDDGFDDLAPLEEEVEQIAELLEAIRKKLGGLTLVA